MSYYVATRWGASEDSPNEARMREILAELATHDPEHPDTWLTHETGWTLSVYDSGLLVWENLQSPGQARHQLNVTREEALALWLKLSRGDIAAIEQGPWRPNQCPPVSTEERAELARRAEADTLASLRSFYDQLGPERTGVLCRHPRCNKGAIINSVFCRAHHFEMIYHRECPFQE